MHIYSINDIAIKNKYTKWYTQIIQNALLRTELLTYSERHHIIPDCFYIKRSRPGNAGWIEGNPSDKSNLIRLTAKEHFVVHLLLTKMFEKNSNAYNKMIRSFHALSCKSSNQNRFISGRTYTVIKQELSKIVYDQMKGMNSAKCSLTNRKLGRIPLSDPRWANGKIINANKHYSMSDEGRLIRSLSSKGKPNLSMIGMVNAIFSDTNESAGRVRKTDIRFETGEIKIRKPEVYAAKITATNEKIKVSLNDIRWKTGEIVGLSSGTISTKKGKPSGKKGIPLGKPKQVCCPTCNKIGSMNNMHRYHFDNCQSLPNPLPKEKRNRKKKNSL